MRAILEQWRERIRLAAEAGQPLCIRGSGTKDFYGGVREGDVLDTRAYHGILEYEPTELVVRARAGTQLRTLEAALGAHSQMLGFEPPYFGPDATLGGAVACGLSGPRRAAAGSVRDFVLGASILDGRGNALAFGGKVMKNVAGYDVSRLMVGAMGTLGLLLEVSLKVLPRPERELTLRFEADQAQAIEWLNAWAGKPYPITASCHETGILHVRLAGSAIGVETLARTLGGAPIANGADMWRDLREQHLEFFAGSEPLWRLSVKSSTPVLALPGRQLIEWNGALRWLKTHADAEHVRAAARSAGGHATLFKAEQKTASVFQPLPEPVMAVHRRLKQTFDPARILNRGRLYGTL